MPRTSAEHEDHLEEIRIKAAAAGVRHGQRFRAIRISTGRTMQCIGIRSWKYLRDVVANA